MSAAAMICPFAIGNCFAMQQFSTELLRVLSTGPRPRMWSRLAPNQERRRCIEGPCF